MMGLLTNMNVIKGVLLGREIDRSMGSDRGMGAESWELDCEYFF